MEKIVIQNRKGQKVVVVVDHVEQPKGLAFFMHGFSGTKDERHTIAFATVFREKGFTTVRFDTTNTLGESDGRLEDATVTSSFEDLEDVIAWAKTCEWYREPFVLVGHSMGGMGVILFAERHPEQVSALAPISTLVSGYLNLEARERHNPGSVEAWQKTGWIEEKSISRGIIKRLPWSHAKDKLKYDLIPEGKKLTMPVLLIVGEKDASAPPDHVKQLYDVLPGRKDMFVIPDSDHNFLVPHTLEKAQEA